MFIPGMLLITGFFMTTYSAADVEQRDRKEVNSTAACFIPVKHASNSTELNLSYNITQLCGSFLCSPEIVHQMKMLQELKDQYEDFRFKYVKTWIPVYFHNVTASQRRYVEILQTLTTNVSDSCVLFWTLLLNEELALLQQVEQEDDVVLVSESWVYYVLPPFVCIVVVVSLPLNMVLMVIIARHREMRTCPNIILLNLSIGDTFFLLIHVVLNYILTFLEIELNEVTCCVYSFANALTTNVSVYSMVVLSIQRFMATTNSQSGRRSLNSFSFQVVSVWLLSGLSAMFAVTYRRPRHRCFMDISVVLVVCDFLFTCILPMLVILAFYMATSRRLRYSVRSMPGEARGLQRVKRHREKGALILPALAVVFAITYLPMYTLDTIHFLSGFSYTRSKVLMHLYYISLLLFPLNSNLNPIALCIVSRSFRQHFKNYILCR